MESTTQAHSLDFGPVFHALDNAKQAQKILKFNAYKSIDKAIESLKATLETKGDVKQTQRQIKDLKSLRKTVEKSNLKDSESVKKLTNKVIGRLDGKADESSLKFLDSCSKAFDEHIATAKTTLKGIQRDYKATAPKKGGGRRITTAFGKIVGMLGRSPNKNSLAYIERSAHKLEELVRNRAETPLSKRDLQISADTANRKNLSLLTDNFALLNKYPHGGAPGEISRFMMNVNLAIRETQQALDSYQGKDTSQPAKDLQKHINTLEAVRELDPAVKSRGEIQKGLINALMKMDALQSKLGKNL
jgi:hypothetical protein